MAVTWVGWAGTREATLVRRPFEHATNLQESDHAAQPIHRGGLPPGRAADAVA